MAYGPSDWKWIFSLSIDEDLRWGATRIHQFEGYSREEPLGGFLCDLPHTDDTIDLHSLVYDHLASLKEFYPDLFRDVVAVGVSTVGIVSKDLSRLTNFDRKKWRLHEDRQGLYLVDFARIIGALFSARPLISVQNDATAKCQAEFFWQKEYEPMTGLKPVDPLCYVNFHDGVNGAFVEGAKDRGGPVAQLAHQELGHVHPPLHREDLHFEKYPKHPHIRGCPVHHTCFVGLAGGRRIIKQWGKYAPDATSPAEILRSVEERPERPWEIISHYISHFCLNAILTIPTKRILLSGSVIFPDLLPSVITKFNKLNTYNKMKYINYPELDEPNFISLAPTPVDVVGVAGGAELARIAYLYPGTVAAISTAQKNRKS